MFHCESKWVCSFIYLSIYYIHLSFIYLMLCLCVLCLNHTIYIESIIPQMTYLGEWVSLKYTLAVIDLSICNLLQKTVSLDSRQNCTKCDPVNCVVLQGEFWKRQVIWSSFVLFLIKFYLQVTRVTISNSTFKSSVVTLRDTASKILRDFKEDSII